jgi:ethanolamine utilization protein EutQ (cupin superfamily)
MRSQTIPSVTVTQANGRTISLFPQYGAIAPTSFKQAIKEQAEHVYLQRMARSFVDSLIHRAIAQEQHEKTMTKATVISTLSPKKKVKVIKKHPVITVPRAQITPTDEDGVMVSDTVTVEEDFELVNP